MQGVSLHIGAIVNDHLYESPIQRHLWISFLKTSHVHPKFPRANVPVALDHVVVQDHSLALEQKRSEDLACGAALSSATRAVVVLHVLEGRRNHAEAAVHLLRRILLALDPRLIVAAPP